VAYILNVENERKHAEGAEKMTKAKKKTKQATQLKEDGQFIITKHLRSLIVQCSRSGITVC
jgi:hypothetical protein